MGAPNYMQSDVSTDWKHEVRASGVDILVDGHKRRITLTKDEVRIGCTTVSRDVIEKVAAEFRKYFPDGGEVVLQ